MQLIDQIHKEDDDDEDDDEDDEEEETSLESYETPLDKDDCEVDEYQIFKAILESRSCFT